MTSSGADPWSGIPDDLRRLIREYAISDWVKDTPAEAALCAALRALVADRERLNQLIVWFSFNDTFEGSGMRDWNDDDDARKAIDEAHYGVWRATPGVAKEDAE